MTVERFEDIIAWQKAKELTKEIYSIFKDNKDYGFKDQIQRASISIMNNIAEGFERGSDADFKRFLYIAKGSSGEVRSMLLVANDLNFIAHEDIKQLLAISEEISKAISGFIKALN